MGILTSLHWLVMMTAMTMMAGAQAFDVNCTHPAKEGYPHTFSWKFDRSAGQYVVRYSNRYDVVARCPIPQKQRVKEKCVGVMDKIHIAHIEKNGSIHEITVTIRKVDKIRDSTVLSDEKLEELERCRLQVYSQCPDPAIEGSTYTFSQTVPIDSKFTWQMETPSNIDPSNVARCYTTRPKPLYCKNTDGNSSTSTITDKGNGKYTVNLTIHEVSKSRDGTIWQWRIDNNLHDGCYLSVVAKASSPVCNTLQLTNTGSSSKPEAVVTWMCSVSKVYQGRVCQFEYAMTMDPNSTIVVNQKYVSEKSLSTHDGKYFDHSCNLTLPLRKLAPGTYKFKVASVILNWPAMEQQMVENDLVLSSSGLTCTEPTLSNGNTAITTDCSITSPYHEITCRLLVSDERNIFEAVNASIDVDQPTCIGSPYRCTTTCSITRNIASFKTAGYRFQVEAYVRENGIEQFKVDESNTSMEIRFKKPIASIKDCPEDYIKSESTTETCKCYLSDKGYPPGNPKWFNHDRSDVHKQVDDGIGTSTLTLQPKKRYYCAGMSTLGLGSTTNYTPMFAYKPTISYFRANGQYTNRVVVGKGKKVTFECAFEGTPEPSTSIRVQSTMEDLGVVDKQRSPMTAEMIMGCQHTDNYTCTAENGLGTAEERSVAVFVQCSPKSPSTTPGTYSVVPGLPLQIEVPITGYPKPNDYILYKSENEISETPDDVDGDGDGDSDTTRVRRSLRTINGTSGRVTYEVNYVEAGETNGTVVVRMSGLQPSDSGHYVLVIKNGIGEGLQHSFSVVVMPSDMDPMDPSQPNGRKTGDSGSGGGGGGGGGSSGNDGADGSVLTDGVVAGVVVVGVVVIAVIAIVVVVLKKKKTDARHKDKQLKYYPKESEDEVFVEINNDIYGLDNEDLGTYSQLNEDEIVSIRKASNPANNDDDGYQKCTDQEQGQGQSVDINNSRNSKVPPAVPLKTSGHLVPVGKEWDTTSDYVYI